MKDRAILVLVLREVVYRGYIEQLNDAKVGSAMRRPYLRALYSIAMRLQCCIKCGRVARCADGGLVNVTVPVVFRNLEAIH